MPAEKVLSEEDQMIENLIQSKIKGLKEFCDVYKELGKTMKGLVQDHKDFKACQKKIGKIGAAAAVKASEGSSEASEGSSAAWWNEEAVQTYFEENAPAGSEGVSKSSLVQHVGAENIKENKWSEYKKDKLVQSNPVQKSPRNFKFCLK